MLSILSNRKLKIELISKILILIFTFCFFTASSYSFSEKIAGCLGVTISAKSTIFATPVINSRVLCILSKNTNIAITGESNGFYVVLMINGDKGYVRKTNVQLSNVGQLFDVPKKNNVGLSNNRLDNSRNNNSLTKKRDTPFFRPSSKKIYLSVGSGHWIKSVTDDGGIVILEDGSMWSISPIDRIDSALWLPITDITVIENNFSDYNYKLINKDDGESVEANLISNG